MKLSEVLAKALIDAQLKCNECKCTTVGEHHVGCCLGKLIDAVTWTRLINMRKSLR